MTTEPNVLVDNMTIEVVDGGIYYYLSDQPRPSKPLDLTEARRACESAFNAAALNIRRLTKLKRAIGAVEAAQS